MKIGRKAPTPTARQRLRSPGQPEQSVKKTFSYSSRRSDAAYNTGRQLQRDLKESATKGLRYSLQRFGMVILFLAILISLVNILKLSSDTKIQPLSSGVVLPRSSSEYEKYADMLLSNSVWNHNKVTVNTSELSARMLKQFPELTDVSVTIPLLAHKPIVYLQPSNPRLILMAGNGAFVVADSGKALLRGEDAGSLNLPDLPVITDQSGLQLGVGYQALSTTSVSFIRSVIAQLNAAHVSVGSMTLPSNANELDVQIAGQSYSVKFNLHSDKAREEAGTYLATIASLQKQGITPAKYVDVRVDGRAYYQ